MAGAGLTVGGGGSASTSRAPASWPKQSNGPLRRSMPGGGPLSQYVGAATTNTSSRQQHSNLFRRRFSVPSANSVWRGSHTEPKGPLGTDCDKYPFRYRRRAENLVRRANLGMAHYRTTSPGVAVAVLGILRRPHLRRSQPRQSRWLSGATLGEISDHGGWIGKTQGPQISDPPI